MRCFSFRTSGLSLAFLFASALASAVGCMSMDAGESGVGDWGTSGVGGGIVLPGAGGAGGSLQDAGTNNPTPPYLMGSYAYLCGGDKATCVPGKSVCSTIDPSKNDSGFGGSISSSGTGTGGTSGVGGSSTTGTSSGAGGSSGVGGSNGVGGSSGAGGDSSTTGSGSGGGSSSTGTSSSGVGGDSSTTAGTSSGAGGSSTGSGAGGSSGGGTTGSGGGTSTGTGSSGSSTGSGNTSDGGIPATLTCKLSPGNDGAQAICTAPGDLTAGDPCQTVDDCGVGLACVATASGGLCRPYCCGQVEDCPGDTYCAPSQMAEAAVEIPVCLPAHKCKVLDELTCPAGQTCTIVRDDGTTSCVEIGEGVRGDGCPCAQGHVCSKYTNTCLKLCHIGNDAADCGAGSCQGGVMAYPDGIGICVGYP